MRHRICVLLFLLFVIAGCSDPGVPRAAIEGQVTVAGAPLPAGRVLFVPIAPTEGPAASAGIVNGRYRIPEEEGPVVGKNRVEIEAELPLGFALDDEAAFAKRGGRPLPPQPIPPKYNRQSELTVDVKPADVNRFDVAIP